MPYDEDTMTVTLEELRALAEAWMTDAPDLVEGEPLDAVTRALLDFGLQASVTSLDGDRLDSTIAAALKAGATAAQLGEVLSLVSGLGVHSLMAAAARIVKAAGGELATAPLDAEQQKLWDKHVGTDPYWATFERDVPGFLDAMLRLSPENFRAFFLYCAVPWRTRTVPGLTKELISLASDACPSHRFLPGFRLHLGNAIKLGVGRRALRDTLDLAAASPLHVGYRG